MAGRPRGAAMEAAIVASIVALVMLGRAILLLSRERGLRSRLLPVQARILDPGRSGAIQASDQSWSDWQTYNRDRAIREGTDPHTNLPSAPHPVYSGRWEYEVGGKRYEAKVEMLDPIFTAEQARAKRVTVYYDRTDPSVSVVSPGATDQAWAWFVGTAIVAAFAILFAVIGHLTSD